MKVLPVKTVADPEHNPTRVVTLTKEGHKLLSQGKVVNLSQVTYHGLKKPKKAFHNADLYRLYHKVSDEIESRGGSVVRVKLDYGMKRKLYARLARAAADMHAGILGYYQGIDKCRAVRLQWRVRKRPLKVQSAE